MTSVFIKMSVFFNPKHLTQIRKFNADHSGLNQSNGSNPSASAISDGYLVPLDDNRHLALPTGALEQLVHVLLVLLDVDILMSCMGRPDPFRIGSTGFPINDHFRTHCYSSSFSHLEKPPTDAGQ